MLERRATGAARAVDRMERRPRIAVLEDDEAFRTDVLMPGLTKHGFDVEGFANPTQLYRRMLAYSFDVVLLDVGLPGEDGLSVARYLRAASSVGIVVLTGRRDVRERITGLDDAVDVWLSKPTEIEMIVATCRSLLRRILVAAPAQSITLARKQWRVDMESWALYAPSGRYVELTRSERSILRCLQMANGEPVSREVLIAELGESVEAFDAHRLEMIVHRLRRKVASALGEPLPLRSVRGRGYVLTG